MHKTGLVITAKGEVREHQIKLDKERGGLDGLQAVVGGYIQPVYLEEKTAMYMNEEGKLKGLPFNQLATLLLQHYSKDWKDPIVGDVIIISDDEEGALADLVPMAELKRVLKTLEAFANDE